MSHRYGAAIYRRRACHVRHGFRRDPRHHPIFCSNAARIFGIDEFAAVTNEPAYDEIWNADDESAAEVAGGSELAALKDEEEAELVKR